MGDRDDDARDERNADYDRKGGNLKHVLSKVIDGQPFRTAVAPDKGPAYEVASSRGEGSVQRLKGFMKGLSTEESDILKKGAHQDVQGFLAAVLHLCETSPDKGIEFLKLASSPTSRQIPSEGTNVRPTAIDAPWPGASKKR